MPAAARTCIPVAGMAGHYGERRPVTRPARQSAGVHNLVALLKTIATRGAVGKTARWAAHLYHRWLRLAPEDPVAMDSIFAALIATRYDFAAFVCTSDHSHRIRSALRTLHDAGEIRSICHAVVLMIAAETDFVEHDWAAKTAFVEAVGAELMSMGVPSEHAFGEDPYSCPERLCAVYLPSTWMLGLLLGT